MERRTHPSAGINGVDKSSHLGQYIIPGKYFRTQFLLIGKQNIDCYGNNLMDLEEKELLKEKDGFLRLTKKGIDVSNYVFGELLYRECEA